ncbi:MAG TPA: hypothetical protein VGN09_05595 [Vicinamibacteria bacterium]
MEQALAHYRVTTLARFEPQADAVLALLGAEAGAVLARAGAENPPIEPEAHTLARLTRAPVRVVRAGDLPGDGFVLHVPSRAVEPVAAALRAAGAAAATVESLDVQRIEAGRP